MSGWNEPGRNPVRQVCFLLWFIDPGVIPVSEIANRFKGDLQMRKVKMGALLTMLSGATLFGGCLGSWWNAAIQGLPGTIIAEWLTDNDGIFDLFEDGGTAAAPDAVN